MTTTGANFTNHSHPKETKTDFDKLTVAEARQLFGMASAFLGNAPAPKDGGPAFPVPEQNRLSDGTYCNEGMSLRDWLAGQALTGVLAGYWSNADACGFSPRDFAETAYEQADAMIAARGQA